MKDKTKILASLFRKWRKENNFTYYQIKKEEGDSIRVDQLARIEKGQEVTTKKLLACIHFCHEHGYDIHLKYGVFPDRPYDSPGVWGDATRIRRIMARYRDGKA